MMKFLVLFSLIIQYVTPLRNEMFVKNPSPGLSPECPRKRLESYGIGRFADLNEYILPYEDKILPRNCLDIMKQGNVSGIYWIQPIDSKAFRVLCDMDTWNGGWTHIQKRYDGSEDFYLPWRDYKHGFGYLNREHWLGLESIYAIARHQAVELLVELTDHNGDTAYAHYDYFQIGSEQEAYKLSALSGFKGDAGDSLYGHLGMAFSTYDIDRDICKDKNCAERYLGAWWYNCCYSSNLNGKLMNMDVPEQYAGQGVHWHTFKNMTFLHFLSKVRMLVRPAYR